MIDLMKNWILNIAVIIIFVTLMDMILPNKDMKRFVKVIIGLLVIMVIMKPFIQMKDLKLQFNTSLLETEDYVNNNTFVNNSSSISRYQKQATLKIYEDNIKKYIVNTVSTKNSIKQENIIVELSLENDIEKKNFGEIKNVMVTINKHSSTIQVGSIKVDKVSINGNKKVIKENKLEYNLNDSKLIRSVKSNITEALGVSQQNIAVKIQE